MTPSQYVKSQGLPSLAHVAREVRKPERTLFNWYHNNFALFEVVVDGLVYQYIMKDCEGKNWRKMTQRIGHER